MSVRQVKNKKEYTKDGRSWVYEARYNGRTYKSKKYKTKKQAENAERDFFNKVESNTLQNSKMTFGELLSRHFDDQLNEVKRTTIANYQNRSRHLDYFKDIKVVNINLRIINDWKKELNSTDLQTRTKNDILKYFKSILNYGKKMYKFDFNDFYDNITNFKCLDERKKEMDFYTYEEFLAFISVEEDLKYKCLFEILYYCGLRRGELLGLSWDNIDFNSKRLSVEKNVVNVRDGTIKHWAITTPKTVSSRRSILIPNVLLEHLLEYKNRCEKCYGFNNSWFVSGNVAPLSSFTLRDRKNKDSDKAGLRRIRIHDFRHSCASLLVNSGANVTVVAKYLGHSKIDETLNTYAHMFDSKQNEVTDIINKLENK